MMIDLSMLLYSIWDEKNFIKLIDLATFSLYHSKKQQQKKELVE